MRSRNRSELKRISNRDFIPLRPITWQDKFKPADYLIRCATQKPYADRLKFVPISEHNALNATASIIYSEAAIAAHDSETLVQDGAIVSNSRTINRLLRNLWLWLVHATRNRSMTHSAVMTLLLTMTTSFVYELI